MTNDPSTAWHSLPPDRVLDLLDSSPSGLTTAEAQQRRERFGKNELRIAPPETAWKILLRQLRSIVVLLLFVAAGVALFLGDWLEAVAIGAVLALNTILGFTMELRARRSIQALLALEVPSAVVIRDGKTQEIAASELVPGDVVVVEAGGRVPADLRVLTVTNLRTAEAELTGESVPLEKSPQALASSEVPLAERTSMLYMSTHVVAGRGSAVVTATGAETEVGRVGGLLGEIQDEATPLEVRLSALGRRLVWLALAAGILVGIVAYAQGQPATLVLKTALALAIAAVPEGLLAVSTMALAIGVHRMARRQALVRRLPAVEALGSVTVVCTDKTGTLTAGQMTVTELWVSDRCYHFTGAGYAPDGEVHHQGEVIEPNAEHDALLLALRVGALANRAELVRDPDGWGIRGDPTEGALLTAARKGGVDPAAILPDLPETAELPFSSDHKLMATFHRPRDGGLVAFVKGAPEKVLERCDRWAGPHGESALTEEAAKLIRTRNDEMAARGLRVLGLAYSSVVAAPNESALTGLIFVGLAGITDPPASGVKETVIRFRDAGLRTVMITGDQRLTAAAVAEELGIDTSGGALDGHEIDRLGDAELSQHAERVSVYSRVSPEGKLRLVKSLRDRGEIVAMLGDGVNDAPALKRADIGVAMGTRGTDLAKAAAAIVLQDDRFVTIGAAVEEGRVIFDNIRKFVFYLFSCNLAEVLVLVVAGILGWPLPLLPLQILWMNVVTDTFPALALALEPAEEDVMRRPPRDPRAAIMSRHFLEAIGFHALTMTTVTLVAFALALRSSPDQAGTVAFMTLSLAQIFHLGNARSLHPVLSYRRAVSNGYAIAAVVFTAGLQFLAIYFAPLALVLDLQPLTVRSLLVVIPLSLVPAALGQTMRFVRSRRRVVGST